MKSFSTNFTLFLTTTILLNLNSNSNIANGALELCDMEIDDRVPGVCRGYRGAAACERNGCCYDNSLTSKINGCFEPTRLFPFQGHLRKESSCFQIPHEEKIQCGNPNISPQECVNLNCCFSQIPIFKSVGYFDTPAYGIEYMPSNPYESVPNCYKGRFTLGYDEHIERKRNKYKSYMYKMSKLAGIREENEEEIA
eukprot:Pgem_evm1s3123